MTIEYQPIAQNYNSQFETVAQRLQHVLPEIEIAAHMPLIEEIQRLKKQKKAVILAHSYQLPEIYHGVADFVGDSLGLARQATKVDAEIIVQCGVHFMAETSKILNPAKTVLIPDTKAGCSLASSIRASDVVLLKERYPNVPVVTYVNTSAEVKAHSDVCCTSANARDIIKKLGEKTVICIPDEFLAKNIAKELTDIKIITWQGRCEVHERFDAEQIKKLRKDYPGTHILAHPECPPEVIEVADFSGSTTNMSKWVSKEQPKSVVLITECSMSDNISIENPNVRFIRPCNICPHMKRITLKKVRDALVDEKFEVEVPPDIANRAAIAVQKMIEMS